MGKKHKNFVVFLDVDGVLNTRTTVQQTPKGYQGIDDARVEAVVDVNPVMVANHTGALLRATIDGAGISTQPSRSGGGSAQYTDSRIGFRTASSSDTESVKVVVDMSLISPT